MCESIYQMFLFFVLVADSYALFTYGQIYQMFVMTMQEAVFMLACMMNMILIFVLFVLGSAE